MSRKNRNKKIDTGGLNLSLPPEDEPVIDVSQAPVFGGIDLAAKDAEATVHYKVSNVTADSFTVEPIPQAQGVLVEDGLPLFTALQQSPYLHMAARPTEVDGYVVVSNGLRFWTATRAGLDPVFVEGVRYNDEDERLKLVWRPVVGSESGLRVA